MNISGGEFADGVVAIEQAIVTKTGGNVMNDFEAEGMAQLFLRGYSYAAVQWETTDTPTTMCSPRSLAVS